MLFCDTQDLIWEIISVSEKRMKNCIVKIINNVFEKKWRRWVISFNRTKKKIHEQKKNGGRKRTDEIFQNE